MKLALGWPPKELRANSNAHYLAKARATRKYRAECACVAMSEGWHLVQMQDDGPIRLRVTYCPPDRRHRDFINMGGSMKAGMDGLADALGVNDKRFRIDDGGDWGPVVKGGAVIVEVTP